jgi:hypothetical protein
VLPQTKACSCATRPPTMKRLYSKPPASHTSILLAIFCYASPALSHHGNGQQPGISKEKPTFATCFLLHNHTSGCVPCPTMKWHPMIAKSCQEAKHHISSCSCATSVQHARPTLPKCPHEALCITKLAGVYGQRAVWQLTPLPARSGCVLAASNAEAAQHTTCTTRTLVAASHAQNKAKH